MRCSHLYSVLIALAALFLAGCAGCGSDTPAISVRPCTLPVEELVYAADACDSASVVLREWDCTAPFPLADWPAGHCFGDRSRVVRLAPPPGGTLSLTVYNAGRGTVSYQLAGLRGGQLEAVADCQLTKTVVDRYDVPVSGFDSLYLRIEADPKEDNQAAIDRLLRSGSYVEITAHDGVLTPPRVTDREELIELARSGDPCLGSFTGRLVVTTCGPEVDLANWAAELGLEIEGLRVHADGSSTAAVLIPNAAGNPRKAQDAVADGGKPDVNNDSIAVEADIRFAIQEPVDVFLSNSIGQGQSDFNVQAYRECVDFSPTAGPASATDPGVRVAIIDSGVDSLGTFGAYFLANPFTDGRLGYDYKSGIAQPADSLSHGTSVAGIVLGRYRGEAPLALLHQKIFDGNGVATYYGALVAIQEAIDAEVDLINASWGIPATAPRQGLICALERAGEAGIIVVTSAGNDQRNLDREPQYPAALAGTPGFGHVVTVAAYGPYVYQPNPANPYRAFFSNYSPVHATLAAFATAETPRQTSPGNWELGYPTGTSFAAPLVTAALATYLGNGATDPLGLLKTALETSTGFGDSVTVDSQFLSICHRPEEVTPN